MLHSTDGLLLQGQVHSQLKGVCSQIRQPGVLQSALRCLNTVLVIRRVSIQYTWNRLALGVPCYH